MAKHKPQSKAANKQHPVVTVTVHAQFRNHTAFKLGYFRGFEGSNRHKTASFIYQSTATAYAAGFMAGCAARAALNN